MTMYMRFTAPLVAGFVLAAPMGPSAQAPAARAPQTAANSSTAAPSVTVADYTRAVGLQAQYTGKAPDVVNPPVWLKSGRFWYRKSVAGGRAFVIVDPAAGTKRPAFDHAKLAGAIGAATGKSTTAASLPFTTFAMS